VVHVGGTSNVVGFRLDNGKPCKPKQIPNSSRFLSTNNSSAGGLAFSPDGRFLVVIERLPNDIDVFSVQGDSTLSPIVVSRSANPGAFSVSFAPNGAALVSETGASGVTNGSAIPSYEIAANGTLSPTSTSVPRCEPRTGGMWSPLTAASYTPPMPARPPSWGLPARTLGY
jgi:6-phosphogluconolactonase